ncbi:DUF2946 domain-containing protein [Dyella sp. ASV21]|uniref:DUF2946 family protein n=1 Tax=Dyella sp. ASV21 TaxID=2795114 RepID=UPI0018EBA7F0
MASRRWVAWLALAAMWLLVVAPTLSRAMPPSWIAPDLGAWCTGHGLSTHHPGGPSAPGDPGEHLDRCGYCVLLGHSPLLTSGVILITAAAALPPSAPLAQPSTHGHARLLLGARPRGPPRSLC